MRGQRIASLQQRLQGLVCLLLTVSLLPVVAAAFGLWGLLGLYGASLSAVCLLYCVQVYLTRASSVPAAAAHAAAHAAAPYSFRSRHVLITGGSKGIGKSLALEAIKRHPAVVTLVAREMEALKAAQTDCLLLADQLGLDLIVQIISADIAEPKAAVQCIDTAETLKARKQTHTHTPHTQVHARSLHAHNLHAADVSVSVCFLRGQ